jgi:hypothetical protein
MHFRVARTCWTFRPKSLTARFALRDQGWIAFVAPQALRGYQCPQTGFRLLDVASVLDLPTEDKVSLATPEWLICSP